MNIIRVLIVLSILTTSSVYACLSSVTSSDTIHSKIRGFYANPSNQQYVILDKATCWATGGHTPLASGTISYYYLSFDSNNTFLASSLLASYAKDESVEFRVGSVKDSYNEIAYVIIPAGARAQ